MPLRKALFPGTFDPFTNGHLDIVRKSLRLVDEVVIAIGHNASKKHLFPLEKRMEWIRNVFMDEPRVSVVSYSGLTSRYCKEQGIEMIIRGLRTSFDFEYERQIARVNEHQNPGLMNVFLISDESVSSVSSTIVRDLILYNGDYRDFIPPQIIIDQEPFQ